MKPGDLFRVKSRSLDCKTVTLGSSDLDTEEQEIAIDTVGIIIGRYGSGGSSRRDSYTVVVNGLMGWLFSDEIEVISETR